jgi:hypothetical protein
MVTSSSTGRGDLRMLTDRSADLYRELRRKPGGCPGDPRFRPVGSQHRGRRWHSLRGLAREACWSRADSEHRPTGADHDRSGDDDRSGADYNRLNGALANPNHLAAPGHHHDDHTSCRHRYVGRNDLGARRDPHRGGLRHGRAQSPKKEGRAG